MIRFDIYSNAASSDRGLQRFPSLENLTETFRLWNLEARLIQQVFREEEEINIASSRHAAGVKVRSKAVRETSLEAHIRGCLAWMRSVVARPARGMHLEIEKIRSPNGAPLVFGQIMARKQKVFVSGLSKADYSRLTAQADVDCAQIPVAISQSIDLKNDYLSRATRPTSFFSVIQRVSELGLVSDEMMVLLKDLLASRKSEELKRLNEAQIINLALIHEYLERYEKLILQLTQMLQGEEILGDLPQMFELFTQGIPFEHLKKSFIEFTIEEKREGIQEKRSLVNEIRIGLSRGDEEMRVVFQRRFSNMVIRARIRQDPRLYKMAVYVANMDGQTIEALSLPRKLYREWLTTSQLPAGIPDDTQVPLELKQGLFELAVNMVYQGKYTMSFREGTIPLGAQVARNLLHCFTFDQFELKGLFKLHPNLPARGVARNLAAKVPVCFGEMARIKTALMNVLFPLGNMAMEISTAIGSRIKDQEARKQDQEMNAYLMGAISQVNGLNYVLGYVGMTPAHRQGILAAGKMLGLTMLDSRDRVHTQKSRSGASTDSDGIESDGNLGLKGGYQLLMMEEGRRLFPLQAKSKQIATAFQQMLQEHLALRVRRLVSKKLKYLVDLHGLSLFSFIHDHLEWNHRLMISHEQMGALLMNSRLFDLPRLMEFGFRHKSVGNAGSENMWVKSNLEANEQTEQKLFGNSIQDDCQKALAAFEGVIKTYGPGTPGGGEERGEPGNPTIKATLADLAESTHYDLHAPEVIEALDKTTEAAQLTVVLRTCIEPGAQELLKNLEEGVAIEVRLTGPVAYLALLREYHEIEIGESALRFRLKPARNIAKASLDATSRQIGDALTQRLSKGSEGAALKEAVITLHRHDEAWSRLVQTSAIPLIDQILQETVLSLAKPKPPLPIDLLKMPEEDLLCMSGSSSDQAKFSLIVAHPEKRDIYATLSEMASWMLRFQRLREEMAYYREVAEDIMEIIAGFNMTAFDAPYISRYTRMLRDLTHLLSIRPEELTPTDHVDIEAKALGVHMLVREAYDQERSVPLRDRWMGRIAMRLRNMHPSLKPTFVNVLFEKKAATSNAAEEKDASGQVEKKAAGSGRGVEAYQTFGERVRNVLEVKERLERKKAFILSPGHSQRQLTLNLLDHLQRFKGMQTPIFVDTSLSEAYVDVLRTRVPPYRLFKLASLRGKN